MSKPEVRVLTPDDARIVPWKNGRGTTREFALWPEAASFERGDYDWRLSAAEVAAGGPFSAFAGFERILTVTKGAGLMLAHESDAPRARLRRFEPYRFSGDWATSAELVGGPVTDFNVIYRRTRVRADVQALALAARTLREPLGGPHVFVHVLAGACTARVTGEEDAYELAAGTSLWLCERRTGEELVLAGSGRASEALIVTLATL
ncbi:MAG: HutD family protein [Planctomycetota bacterium]